MEYTSIVVTGHQPDEEINNMLVLGWVLINPPKMVIARPVAEVMYICSFMRNAHIN